MTITVIVTPRGHAGYEAKIDDEVLGVSDSPLLLAGRRLFERGVAPDTQLVTRNSWETYDGLITTVGYANMMAEMFGIGGPRVPRPAKTKT